MSRELPSFDLVVATVDRVDELRRLLDSLEQQAHPRLRVIVADQNEDDRLGTVLEGGALDVFRVRAERGLSRARNAALPHVRADVVAFPDDDCVYPPGLLGRVAERFLTDPRLDGLTGRAEDTEGASSAAWKRDAAALTDRNLWNRAISFTIFLRGEVVARTGPFDQRLGLGCHEPWSSGEEIDYLVRAIRSGARIEYDPSLVVQHPLRADDSRIGFRDGASIGYLLRKHRYPPATAARMLLRPAGGVAVSLVRLDRSRAAYHAATLRGRIRGYRARPMRP